VSPGNYHSRESVKLKEHIVERKKPKLTSPWKVGFLVALLLVVTALGVSYFITGTFGITWHWIQASGASPLAWKFHLGAFLEEMAPLLLLTALLAFAAYVLVAGAVRRYKSYVDSGVEYKQLLKSIKNIDDLEAGEIADRLKGHPELREFLMHVKHRVGALEKQSAERAAKHTVSVQPAPAGADIKAALASDCATLASAIDGGRDQFPSEMTLTIPEVKQIERALRRFFVNMPKAPIVEPSARELEDLRSSLRTTLTALRQDVAACGSGAHEVEAAVATLCAQIEPGTTKPAADTAAVQKRIGAVQDALTMLGEETRKIAIASALQASGGSEADNIKIAEELKTLATRFNAVARHWSETTPVLKEIISGAGSKRATGDAPAAAANVVNRARLWSERAVAMIDHVRALERAAGSPSPASSATQSATASDSYAAATSIDIDTPATESASSTGATGGDEFGVARGAGRESNDDITFADIPGFEKERRFFADAPAHDEKDDQFVVDGRQDMRWDLSEEQEQHQEAPAPSVSPEVSRPEPADADSFLTGPRPTVSARRAEPAAPSPTPRPVAQAPVAAVESAAAVSRATTATLEPDSDAVDLYALGAIDCVQTM